MDQTGPMRRCPTLLPRQARSLRGHPTRAGSSRLAKMHSLRLQSTARQPEAAVSTLLRLQVGMQAPHTQVDKVRRKDESQELARIQHWLTRRPRRHLLLSSLQKCRPTPSPILSPLNPHLLLLPSTTRALLALHRLPVVPWPRFPAPVCHRPIWLLPPRQVRLTDSVKVQQAQGRRTPSPSRPRRPHGNRGAVDSTSPKRSSSKSSPTLTVSHSVTLSHKWQPTMLSSRALASDTVSIP